MSTFCDPGTFSSMSTKVLSSLVSGHARQWPTGKDNAAYREVKGKCKGGRQQQRTHTHTHTHTRAHTHTGRAHAGVGVDGTNAGALSADVSWMPRWVVNGVVPAPRARRQAGRQAGGVCSAPCVEACCVQRDERCFHHEGFLRGGRERELVDRRPPSARLWPSPCEHTQIAG